MKIDMDAVDKLLQAQVRELTGPLRAVCRYATEGGSRTRAALLLQAVPGSSPRVLTAAAALELLHTATLLQDDIFDGSTARRGRTTVHVRFGQAEATLASDWLLIRALELAAEVHPAFFRQMATAGRAMAAAEALELRPPELFTIDAAMEHVTAVARGKTAVLFAGTLLAAALLQPAGTVDTARWQELGTEMGVTYQLVDDCLDVYGSPEALGKCAGNDLRTGCLTLPVLLALQKLAREGTPLPLRAVQALQLEAAQMARLLEAMHSAEVKAELQYLYLERCRQHRIEADRAGVPEAAVQLCLGKLDARLATCFEPASSVPSRVGSLFRPMATSLEVVAHA